MPKHLNTTNIRLTADFKKIFKLFEMLPDTFSLAAQFSKSNSASDTNIPLLEVFV